jgi:hypothetical protein
MADGQWLMTNDSLMMMDGRVYRNRFLDSAAT